MDDAISREQAIKAIEEEWDGCCSEYPATQIIYDTTEAIERIPAIQPKRGRWIKLDMHRGMADHKCTACKQECYVPTCMGEPMYAFCPNCGADMRKTT